MTILGKSFGKLTVVNRDGHDATKKNTAWLCACECGGMSTYDISELLKISTQGVLQYANN